MSPALHEEAFETFPTAILISLRDFLCDDNRYELLSHQLNNTWLMLEKDNFQIPLRSVEQLSKVRSFLEEKFNDRAVSV